MSNLGKSVAFLSFILLSAGTADANRSARTTRGTVTSAPNARAARSTARSMVQSQSMRPTRNAVNRQLVRAQPVTTSRVQTGNSAMSTRMTASSRTEARNTRTRTTETSLFGLGSNSLSPRIANFTSALAQQMVNVVKQDATPAMALVPASEQVTMTQTRQGNYKKATTPAHTLTGVGANGVLDFVMLLPTSGHTGQANAAKWAVQSKYNVRVIQPDGTAKLLGQVQSVDFVTTHGLSLHLKPGKTIVQMWPEGSGGVGGYKAGREVELNWSGN